MPVLHKHGPKVNTETTVNNFIEGCCQAANLILRLSHFIHQYYFNAPIT